MVPLKFDEMLALIMTILFLLTLLLRDSGHSLTAHVAHKSLKLSLRLQHLRAQIYSVLFYVLCEGAGCPRLLRHCSESGWLGDLHRFSPLLLLCYRHPHLLLSPPSSSLCPLIFLYLERICVVGLFHTALDCGPLGDKNHVALSSLSSSLKHCI